MSRLAARVLVSVLMAVMAGEGRADAQYFGANKVRFETPAFRVLTTEHFDVYYYPAEADGARLAARLAERWHARLTRVFDHTLRGRQPLILYASPAAFRQTNIIDGDLGEGTGGVTESLRRRIVLPLAGTLAATDHVIGHELVHAFQFDITARAESASERRAPGAQVLPLWFVEGMAEYFSRGPVDLETAMWLRDAVARDALPPVEKLGDPRYFPYRWGHALWAYVAGRWGEGVLVSALREAGRSGRADTALADTLGVPIAELTRDWHAATREACAGWLRGARAPGAVATAPFAVRHAGELNVGPALSPDGRRLAFLAERDLLSVDLFVADVATGRVLARVASTARDAHLSSLQYVASAGAWRPDGRELAYASRRGGRPTIERYDVESGRRLAPIAPAGVDEVLTPAWSPDGRRLACVGMHRGRLDLFVIDVTTGETVAVTDDPFAELHPIWAPDGRSLIVATDRFTTDMDRGAPGAFQLARVRLDDRGVERLGPAWDGQMFNPQWEDAAGTRLLFVGHRGGVANLWRLAVASGAVTPATDVTTGVTGITATSPALATAPAAGRVAFSALDNGGIRLFVQAPERLEAVERPQARADALPPVERSPSGVAAYLHDAVTGLPASSEGFADAPYRARFALDAVVQPSVGIGVDRFGTYAAGQVALLWGDMLGDRTLVTAFQANATVDTSFSYRDLGGAVGYADRSHRWNWMVAAEQTPYRTGSVQGGVAVVDGQVGLVTQEVIDRQTVQAVSGVASYPLSDARRIELGAGAQRYSFTKRVRTIVSAGGRDLTDTRVERDFPGLTLGRAMAAYVLDRTSFGATSPVLGQRYRVEVAPTAGSLHYTGVLVDYRRYVMPVPFYTLAGRVLHYGRYGAGGADTRLSPLFVGYPELVRGYDVGSFRAEECESAGCPVFDRLLGTRIVVANAELRVPLLRPFGLGNRMYGPVPVELALFGDAGVAWDRGTSPAWLGGSRDWATSAGVAARVNAFGYAVLQFSAARPFQRPGRGWVYQFSLTPGF